METVLLLLMMLLVGLASHWVTLWVTIDSVYGERQCVASNTASMASGGDDSQRDNPMANWLVWTHWEGMEGVSDDMQMEGNTRGDGREWVHNDNLTRRRRRQATKSTDTDSWKRDGRRREEIQSMLLLSTEEYQSKHDIIYLYLYMCTDECIHCCSVLCINYHW